MRHKPVMAGARHHSTAWAVLCAALVLSLGAAAAQNTGAPVDPYAAVRPATDSVGVEMPDAADFPHPWDKISFVMRVTLAGVMPPLNGGVAFVGDSETDSMRWDEMFPQDKSRNFGISGDTSVGLKHRIGQVIAAKPGKVFLQIGTNDIAFGKLSPEAIAANVDDCLVKLQSNLPHVAVFVESVLPRQPEYDATVRRVNAALETAAKKRGVTYIDLYSHFAVDGHMNPSLSPDDIHLSGQGYLIWRDVIRPYIGND